MDNQAVEPTHAPHKLHTEPETEARPTTQCPPSEPIAPPRKSTRVRKRPDRYGYQAMFVTREPTSQTMSVSPDPQSFEQAAASQNSEDWMKAMTSEMDSLNKC